MQTTTNIWGGVVMVFEVINGMPLSILGVSLLLAIIVMAELGMLVGRRAATRESDKDAGSLATATLGLLALLIAFTYSMALARYDSRRQLVLEEANAIGSTANFALMLPADWQEPALGLLRQYARLRLGLGVPYDPTKFEHDVARSDILLGTLWQQAVVQTQAAPQSLPLYRYVASLNETNNIAEKRVTALRNHVPVAILIMLTGTALVAMGFVGYSIGVSGIRRQISTFIMSALLAFLIVMTQDLARPDRGSIQVSTKALQDAVTAIDQVAPH